MAGVVRSLTKKLKSLKDDSGNDHSPSSPAAPRKSIAQESQAVPRRSIAHDSQGVTSQALVAPSRRSLDRSNGSPRDSGSKERSSGSTAGLLKNPVAGLVTKLHLLKNDSGESSDTQSDRPMNRDGDVMSKNQLRKHNQAVEAEHKKEEQLRLQQEIERRKEQERIASEREDSPQMRARYGDLPVNNYAGQFKQSDRIDLLNLGHYYVGQEVSFRARIHTVRKMSAKLSFFLFRQQTATIQGVLQQSDLTSKHMIYWAEHLPVESIMHVRGVVQQPKAKEGEVTGALIHDKEIMIYELHAVSKPTEHLPFTVYEAEVTEEEANAEGSARHHIAARARLGARVLDLRTTTSQATFRVQAGVCGLFRSFLDSQGFIEIHSPKLQGGATESGASVFKVDYFGRTAFLAQSPQLAKQMSIAADFGRVYEIGAVFRAENSNTHRHLTEYTGLDIEMAIDEHYWEARNMIDRTLKAIFKGVYERFGHEIAMIKRQFPHTDLVWLEQTPIIPFKEAITMLNATGWTDEDGKPLPLDEDLGTRDEIQLGRVIKEKYHTDYYIIDKFPASARPFYTMPDPQDPGYTNSFDVFVRGQEIISGGQRVHDAKMLIAQMEKVKVDPKVMEEYMSGFEWGAPPHAGAGVGLERLVMLMLQLGDIRNASMYPRDPKSLPAKTIVRELRHPEASTLHPPWEDMDNVNAKKDYQPLEMLIANYGDASNTSLLEPRSKIWRDEHTGAAVGYVPHNGFAITVGNPLCHSSQYLKIIAGYLDYIKRETSLKPLWLLCGDDTADALGDKYDWRTFSVAAEQRVDLTEFKAARDADIQRKIRHATKEGIKLHDIPIGTPPGREFRAKIDSRIEDWLGHRKEHQHVHLTDVHPWQDTAHRQYHYAVDKEGTVQALVVLAQLSAEHGWQVKFSLDFPGAPNGCIEACVIHALTQLKNAGNTTCTFGGGASADFTPGMNLKGTKIKMLRKAYTTIATELKLTQKSEFRDKLGAEPDPIYICYPPKGLGPKGVHAILSFFED